MLEITPLQKKIGEFIINYRATYVYSPTVSAISKKFKKHRATMYGHLKRMESKKYLKSKDHKFIPTQKLIKLFIIN